MTISQVAEKYGIPADTLRYYEKAGLLKNVPRTPSGIRDFDEEACRAVEFVLCMRGAGVSVEALAEYLTLYEQGEETAGQRKELLIGQRKQLEMRMQKLKTAIERLDYKIGHYEELAKIHGGGTCDAIQNAREHGTEGQ